MWAVLIVFDGPVVECALMRIASKGYPDHLGDLSKEYLMPPDVCNTFME